MVLGISEFDQPLGWVLIEVIAEGDYAEEARLIKQCQPDEIACVDTLYRCRCFTG